MDTRQINGLDIAARRKVKKKGDVWLVPSQRGNGTYSVIFTPELATCTCTDYELHRRRCKHIWAVEYTIERESGVSDRVPLIEKEPIHSPRPTYRQDWPAYNAAQCNEKRDFRRLLHDLCKGIETPGQKRGRPSHLYADVLYAAILRAYLTKSGRRSACDIEDAAENRFIRAAMHFNTIYRFLQRKDVTPILMRLVTETSLPLAALEDDVAVDSTGLSTGERVPWFDKKYGRDNDFTAWRKLHFLCGTRTHTVISAIPSPGQDHDGRFFRSLVEAIPPKFRVKALSADKAYLDHANLSLVDDVGAIPYIPFKRDSVSSDRHPVVWQMMHAYYEFNREEFLEGYHRRSNAESVVNMIKAKYGARLRSKTPTSQDNEVLTKVIAHNIYVLIQSIYEHHLEPMFWGK